MPHSPSIKAGIFPLLKLLYWLPYILVSIIKDSGYTGIFLPALRPLVQLLGRAYPLSGHVCPSVHRFRKLYVRQC